MLLTVDGYTLISLVSLASLLGWYLKFFGKLTRHPRRSAPRLGHLRSRLGSLWELITVKPISPQLICRRLEVTLSNLSTNASKPKRKRLMYLRLQDIEFSPLTLKILKRFWQRNSPISAEEPGSTKLGNR
jgi:hypothetical protein